MIDLGRLRALVAHDAEAFPPSRAELRLSRALVLVATAWLALVVSWELFGPILAGHYASSASTGIIAENMRRWGIVAPVWSYTRAAPDPSLYYCHHPWGIFWTTAGFQAVLGRHDFVCRLPAALLSVATPAIVYALGRDLYRPLSGALGAAAFAVLPITLSFAAFNALEVPVIAYGALFLWAWLRAKRGHGRRWTALAALAAALAMLSDWPGSLLVFVALAVEAAAFARAPRAFGPRGSGCGSRSRRWGWPLGWGFWRRSAITTSSATCSGAIGSGPTMTARPSPSDSTRGATGSSSCSPRWRSALARRRWRCSR